MVANTRKTPSAPPMLIGFRSGIMGLTLSA
jgi:hypothetical protein